jgi:hypothetical protein
VVPAAAVLAPVVPLAVALVPLVAALVPLATPLVALAVAATPLLVELALVDPVVPIEPTLVVPPLGDWPPQAAATRATRMSSLFTGDPLSSLGREALLAPPEP